MNVTTPVLETERLILRPTRSEDFDAYARFMDDDEAARFIGGAQSRTIAWRGFLQIAGAWQLQGYSMFSVISKQTGNWIGRVGPWVPEGWPGNEIGWGIVPDLWGRGYATEAARAAIDWAFDALGWDEIIHAIAPDNPGSQAVARKLGSANWGPGRLPPPFDEDEIDIWGQTRTQWMKRRGADRDAIAE